MKMSTLSIAWMQHKWRKHFDFICFISIVYLEYKRKSRVKQSTIMEIIIKNM